MIQWHKMTDSWNLYYSGYAFHSLTFREMIVCCLEIGISWKQMIKACDELDKNEHCYAEFTANKRFSRTAKA